MIDLLYRWALADREPLTSYAVEMLSYGETLCSRYHQNNMEVVSLLLHKLKGMYAKAKSEYLAAHPTSSSLGSCHLGISTVLCCGKIVKVGLT